MIDHGSRLRERLLSDNKKILPYQEDKILPYKEDKERQNDLPIRTIRYFPTRKIRNYKRPPDNKAKRLPYKEDKERHKYFLTRKIKNNTC